MGIPRALAVVVLGASFLPLVAARAGEEGQATELERQRKVVRDLSAVLREQLVEIKELKDELLKLKQKIAAVEVTAAKQARELARRHAQIDEMHKIIQNQQRAYIVAKENEQDAKRRLVDADRKLRRLKDAGVPVDKILGAEKENPGRKPVPAAKAPGPVPGKVLAVNKTMKLIMLSVGQDDGDREIGRARVEKAFRKMSSARILTEAAPGKIAEGDSAVLLPADAVETEEEVF